MSPESIYKSFRPSAITNYENSVKAYWFIFAENGRMLVNLEKGRARIPLALDAGELNIKLRRKQYLGTLFGSPCFSAEADSVAGVKDGYQFLELFALYEKLDEDLFWLAGRAIQIMRWDQESQFCSHCGSPTETLSKERAKKCPACGFLNFPRLSPAVITAVLKGNQILLVHSRSFPDNLFSLIAGFIEPGETAEECVRREIMEEVGIEVKNIKYFTSQPWPFPNSLMFGFTAEYDRGEIQVDGTEITAAGWYALNDLPEIPSRISIARRIIDWCVETQGC